MRSAVKLHEDLLRRGQRIEPSTGDRGGGDVVVAPAHDDHRTFEARFCIEVGSHAFDPQPRGGEVLAELRRDQVVIVISRTERAATRLIVSGLTMQHRAVAHCPGALDLGLFWQDGAVAFGIRRDRLQFLDRSVSPLRFASARSSPSRRLVASSIHDLAQSDISVKPVRMPLRQPHAEDAAEGMAEQKIFCLP